MRSGSATDADKRKLKRIQIELGSKGKTRVKAKAPAPKANRQKASLQREAASRKAEASRRAALQQLFEDSLPIDEDVAGRALDQGTYAKYSEPQRAALNKALQRPSGAIGQQRPDPSMMTPPMRRGVSRSSRPTGSIGPLPSPSDFERNPPVRSRDIDEDFAGRRGLPSLELMSKAPIPPRSSGGRGDMAAQNKGYETLREYFIEDMTPRRSKVMTPFGIIDIDSTEDAYGSGDEITDMQIEMGQKKGGRLKKKKKPATRKKVAAKKKKVAVKKKPVVRKKVVAKKPLMRKKTVAKKPAGRKRAAKRGFGAELRGN